MMQLRVSRRRVLPVQSQSSKFQGTGLGGNEFSIGPQVTKVTSTAIALATNLDVEGLLIVVINTKNGNRPSKYITNCLFYDSTGISLTHNGEDTKNELSRYGLCHYQQQRHIAGTDGYIGGIGRPVKNLIVNSGTQASDSQREIV